MSKVLETSSGEHVPEIRVNPKMLLNTSISMYGTSRTGKSYIVKYFLDLLSSKVEQFLLVSPSEPSNRSFENTIAAPLIHYEISKSDTNEKKDTEVKKTVRMLKCIFDRQTMLTTMSAVAKDIKILKKIYRRLPKEAQECGNKVFDTTKDSTKKWIKKVERKFVNDKEKQSAQIDAINEMQSEFVINTYKRMILPFREYLLTNERNLSESEENALLYLIMSPYLVAIFDDCADLLDKVKNDAILKAYFYRNRHVMLTAIYCFQSLKNLESSLRDNTFISVFTCKKMATKYFTNKTNAFEPAEVKKILRIIEVVFDPAFKHRKLVYMRDDPAGYNFYHMTAPPIEKRLYGSSALNEFCEKIKSREHSLDKGNQFYDCFKNNK